MGHRALITYERTDGSYNFHYIYWGGLNLRLRHAITESTPFGSDRPTKAATAVYGNLTIGEPPEYVQGGFDLTDCAADEANPSGRGLNFDDITEAVAWLASPEAEIVNGQFLFIDGGLYL